MTDPMVSRLAGELAALRAAVAALRREQPDGTGVSTAFGATSFRTTQTGFAAELTSGYNSTLGYSWKRLDLDVTVPGFIDPDTQLEGDKAFTIDDDQTLTAGTLGWLDISDTAGGWVFTVANSGGGGGGGGGTACSPAGGWTSLDCLSLSVVSAAGDCANIDTTQVLSLVYDAGNWESGDDAVDVPEDDFVHDLGLGPAVFTFTSGQPRLTIDGVSGFYVGCSGSGLLFSFGGPLLCDGETPHVGCADNSFTVLISCECCPVAGYTTAGWYRVLPTGLTCDDECSGTCVYLASECEAAGYVICDGPFDTEPDCTDDPACDEPPTGDFDCASGTATLEIGAATGSDATMYEVSPGLWQTSTGWFLQSPGFDPNAGGAGDCTGSTWVLYWGTLGTAQPDPGGSCIHCGEVVTDPEDPNFGCIYLADNSGGGVGPEGGACASESTVCCDAGGGLMAAMAAGKPLTLKMNPKKNRPAPCKHLGDEPLTITEKKRLNLPLANTWSPCNRAGKPPTNPQGKSVVTDAGGGRFTCACRGCGPKCSGYEAGQTDQ